MTPREAEAVAVAADALDGAGDPAELVVALVAELARRGKLGQDDITTTVARLTEYTLGAGLRVMTISKRHTRMTNFFGDKVGAVDKQPEGWRVTLRRWNTMVPDGGHHDTREAAEAALVAAQPVPGAVVVVHS